MAVITTTDLENAALDVATIAEVASVGTTATTTTNRSGSVIDTLRGRLLKLGYDVPVAYAGSISFGANDESKTIDRNNVIYAAYPTELPFTTSGTWGGSDESKFYAVQTSVDAVTTDVADLVTLTGVAANSTDLGAFTSTAVPDNSDIKEAIQGVGDYAEDLLRDNWDRLDSFTPTNTNQIQLDITGYGGNSYTKYRIELINVRQDDASNGARLRMRINNDSTSGQYMYQYFVAASPVVAADSTTGTYVEMMNDADLKSADRGYWTIELENIYTALPTLFKTRGSYTSASQTKNVFKACEGCVNDTDLIDTVELYWSNSKLFTAAGTIRVYGYKG